MKTAEPKPWACGFLLVVCLSLAGQGCTHRAWYEGFQEKRREDCYKNPSQAETQECLDRVNGTTYDEYRKSREGSKE